jgi:Fic family protein
LRWPRDRASPKTSAGRSTRCVRPYFSGEIDALRQTFSRELTREQRLAHAWGTASDDLLGSERRQSVLAYLLSQGSINKSSYAEVAAVSLATASKHLGVLTERGLLVQTGKGPSTRYLLAEGPLPIQVTPILGMPAPRSAS